MMDWLSRLKFSSCLIPYRTDDNRAVVWGKPMNRTQQLQAEGRKSRQAALSYLADCFTSPANPATSDQLNEFKATSFYFPDIKQAIDKVERVYTDKEDLRRAIMLDAAYELIERLIR